MTINERIAYLKGLVEGLDLDSDKKEVKLMTAIVDTLADMANEFEAIDVDLMEIAEELEDISDELEAIDDYLFDEDDDFDSFDFLDDFDDEDDFGCGQCGGNEFSLSVDCPACGNDIDISEADLSSGLAACSACGETLEFEYDEEDDDFDDEEVVEESKPKKKDKD